MGLSASQGRLFQLGTRQHPNTSSNNKGKIDTESIKRQLQNIQNQLQRFKQNLSNYPKNGKFDKQIAATQKNIDTLEMKKAELEKELFEATFGTIPNALDNIDGTFNAFEKNSTPTTEKQESSIPAKDIPSETILANTGVVINKPQAEDASKETTTNKATDTTKTEQQDTFETKFQEELEKATLEAANARKTMIKASESRREAVQKLNAFASANNFPRSTVGLGGLSGSQIRFEDLRAGNSQNLAQARQNNTPEYQTYQALEKDVQEATKAVELAEENYMKSQEKILKLREKLKGLTKEEKQDITEKIKLEITKLTENTFNAFE